MAEKFGDSLGVGVVTWGIMSIQEPEYYPFAQKKFGHSYLLTGSKVPNSPVHLVTHRVFNILP